MASKCKYAKYTAAKIKKALDAHVPYVSPNTNENNTNEGNTANFTNNYNNNNEATSYTAYSNNNNYNAGSN